MQPKIISLSSYRTPEQPSGFDWAAYEARAKKRFRRSELRFTVLTAVESVVTAAIGVCVLLCAAVFFTML